MMIRINAAQMTPTAAQCILRTTSNILLFLISQCMITIKLTITAILIMAIVLSNGAAPFTCPNMDPSNCHAWEKSADLKKTQVTFTRKKVNRA